MAIERSHRGPFETLLLRSTQEDSLLEVAPRRGALVTRLRLQGREMLYLDESTFLDETKNVRGGIPVLFPIAGKLPGGECMAGGSRMVLAQHGFARRLPFEVVADAPPRLEEGTPEPEGITMALRSSAATLAEFPFEFELKLTYSLAGGALRCEAGVRNTGSKPMPLHLGFHPYLAVADAEKGATRLDVAATRSFDNRTGRAAAYEPPDLAAEEVDLHVLDPQGGAARLRLPGRESVRLDYGGFPVVVAWTVRGRDFVCLEPWSAPAGALATGEGLEWLPPGAESYRVFFLRREVRER